MKMTLTHFVNKKPDFVFEQFSIAENFAKVHPVIYKMEKMEENNYKVHEKLKFIFIPVKFDYTTTLLPDKEKQMIVMNAVVKKKTKIDLKIVLKEQKGGTLITEEMELTTPLPIKKIFCKLFAKQHIKLFSNIEKL